MPDPNLIPFNHTGVFSVTTGAPGAPAIHAVLSVPANSSIVNGHGLLTQAINPPLHADNSFHGVVHVLAFGGSVTQVYSVQGAAVPPLLGAPHVIQLAIQLDGIWGTTGKATYSYVNREVIHEVKDVPVKVQWLLQA